MSTHKMSLDKNSLNNIMTVFVKYETIRELGNFNMVMDAIKVMKLINATKEQYVYILQHYAELHDYALKHDML